MSKTYDVVVVGGGIIGMAVASYLSQAAIKLALVERKYIGSGSTSRCIGGIRQQFSTPAAIRLMQENLELFSQMEEEFNQSVEFHQGGYLFLAHTREMVEVFKKNIAIQKKEKLNVSLLSPGEVKEVVPHLNIEGVLAGAYCPDDAQAFPFPVVDGYREKIIKGGGELIISNPVTTIKKNKHFQLTLADGTLLEADKVLLSAGPWTGELAKTIGLDLPLFPERHEAIITERIPKFFEPMIVDYRPDGCYFHQLISGQVIACYTPVPNVPGIHEDVSFEFLPQVAWRMSRLVPELKKAAILRNWSGCYTMTPDGNPIVDESEIEGLYIASGMSGHGFMFGPAIGKYLARFMLTGQWGADFSEFSIKREFKSKESMK
ncbi:MAG: FAD-binding oxidoreductase [Candidatus Aminicenantes bacterium]|nr:MAG: FAD-binding oxidoreductase [Candidatus Aminicenantes bacterium]